MSKRVGRKIPCVREFLRLGLPEVHRSFEMFRTRRLHDLEPYEAVLTGILQRLADAILAKGKDAWVGASTVTRSAHGLKFMRLRPGFDSATSHRFDER